MRIVLFCVLMISLAVSVQAKDKPARWVVYYGSAQPWTDFKNYDVVVFDAEHHPDARPLVGRGKTVLGYLSLIEVQPTRSYYTRLREEGLLMRGQPEGAERVDIRNPRWMKLMIEEIIPGYVREGFSGLMLDTVDTALAMEANDPVHYAGMGKAAASVIRHIHMHYPYLKLMVNRGFSILPHVAGDIDMVLAESVYVDSREAPYQLFPEERYQEMLDQLTPLREENAALQFYSLDYWDMKDAKGIKTIYKAQRKAGLIPYVSTHDLQAVYVEP